MVPFWEIFKDNLTEPDLCFIHGLERTACIRLMLFCCMPVNTWFYINIWESSHSAIGHLTSREVWAKQKLGSHQGINVRQSVGPWIFAPSKCRWKKKKKESWRQKSDRPWHLKGIWMQALKRVSFIRSWKIIARGSWKLGGKGRECQCKEGSVVLSVEEELGQLRAQWHFQPLIVAQDS